MEGKGGGKGVALGLTDSDLLVAGHTYILT